MLEFPELVMGDIAALIEKRHELVEDLAVLDALIDRVGRGRAADATGSTSAGERRSK